jgi:hypothetical protein
MKLKKNNHGFGAIEGLLILVIAGILGFTGWFVWDAKQNADKILAVSNSTMSATTRATSKATVQSSKAVFTLPSGWSWYENKDLSFKFAYPTEWGQLKSAEQGSLLLNLYTEQYTNSISDVQGRINLTANSKSSFTLTPQKYSVTLKPKSDGTQWQVTDVNPAVADKYKVGDMYNLQGKQIVNGGVIYLLSSADEGCKMNNYIFVLKNSFANLSTPALCSTEAVSFDNQTAFDKITSNILNSITIN